MTQDDNISIRTKIATLALDSCLINASGPRSETYEALQIIGASSAGAIVSKSATLQRNDGNPKPRSIQGISLGGFCHGSLNSEGLPNAGIKYYTNKHWLQTISQFKKPYVVSAAGCYPEEYSELVSILLEVDEVSAIEINVACPNCPDTPIIGYDLAALHELLEVISQLPRLYNSGIDLAKKPLGLKLPPYFDAVLCKRVAELITKYPIDFVVTCNSAGNALLVNSEDECPVLLANDGFGGLAGGFIKPIALANVRDLYLIFDELHADIDIIGVGGVTCGRDAFELILCGACAVGVGTCFWEQGPACFERIATELKQLMAHKGYQSIDQFRGALQPFTLSSSTWLQDGNSDSSGIILAPKNESDKLDFITATAASSYDTSSNPADRNKPFGWNYIWNKYIDMPDYIFDSQSDYSMSAANLPSGIEAILTYCCFGALLLMGFRVLLFTVEYAATFVGLPWAMMSVSSVIAVATKVAMRRAGVAMTFLGLLFGYTALALSMMFAFTLFLFSFPIVVE